MGARKRMDELQKAEEVNASSAEDTPVQETPAGEPSAWDITARLKREGDVSAVIEWLKMPTSSAWETQDAAKWELVRCEGISAHAVLDVLEDATLPPGVRADAGFILASWGEPRGLALLLGILYDRSANQHLRLSVATSLRFVGGADV